MPAKLLVPGIRPKTTINIGYEKPDVIELKHAPSRQHVNVLIILGEYPNRVVDISDMCERLGIGAHCLRCLITRLKFKFLDGNEWTIQKWEGGYRLIDLRDRW